MKSDLIKQFSLPPYVKGKSFAEASKAISNKFKERKDSAAQETEKELLGRLSKAQEYVKMQESLKNNSQQVPDQMNGQVPEGFEEFAQPQQGQNQMFMGGNTNQMNTDQLVDSGKDAAAGLFGPVGQAVRGAQRMGEGIGNTIGGSGGAAISDIFAPEKSTLSVMTNSDANIGQKALSVIPGVGGIVAKNLRDKEIAKDRRNNSLIQNNQFQNDFAGGGFIAPPNDKEKDKSLKQSDVNSINSTEGTQFDLVGANSLFEKVPNRTLPTGQTIDFGRYDGKDYFKMGNMEGDSIRLSNTKNNTHNAAALKEDMNYLQKLNPDVKLQLDYNNFEDGGYMNKRPKVNTVSTIQSQGLKPLIPTLEQSARNTTDRFGKTFEPTQTNSGNNFLANSANWMQSNYGDILRTAPIVSNAMQLAKLKKSTPTKLDRINSRYKTTHVDERALENRVQNEANNTTRALSNAVNGSSGALRTNLLGSQLQKTNALSDAYLKANDVNIQEDRAAQQFNSRNDMMNLRQDTMEKDWAARDEGAYNSDKSLLQSQLANDIGNFGKETTNKKQVAEMFGYSWDGKYLVGKDGKKYEWGSIFDKRDKKESK